MSEQNEPIFQFAHVESHRFGLRVFRGTAREINEKKILAEVIEDEIDVAILRVPSEKQFCVNRLDRIGLPYLIADTLVYHYVELKQFTPRDLKNKDLEFVECGPEHGPIIDALVDKCFKEYTNHYYSNPYLAKDGILEGYKEWARSYIGSGVKGRIAWLVHRDGKFIGFATCAFDQESDEAEGVLYAVVPEAAGCGVYGDIIRFTQAYFKAEGFARMKVSTQIQNFAVQKVWSREGFFLKQAFSTIHINSFISSSRIQKEVFRLNVSSQDIQKYGDVSGDYNHIHFDDAYAAANGLKDRVAHGLVMNSVISKCHGMIYPGHGTLFMGYSYKFLKPLYLNRDYEVCISFPVVESDKGTYKSVVQVRDQDKSLCMFSYNDLYKKPNVRR